MNQNLIPNPVIGTAAPILADRHSHAGLDSLFTNAGAPGEAPPGNKIVKCTDWLGITNRKHEDPRSVFGRVIENLMEVDASDSQLQKSLEADRKRITDSLAKYGLEYQQGGRIVDRNASASTNDFEANLRQRDFISAQEELDRCLRYVDASPDQAVTAACALLESVFRIYLEEEGVDLPNKLTIKDLWKTVAKHIGFDPARIEDDDLKRVLTGLSSVVDGIGSIRTHAGSAHGHGKSKYRLEARHARLVVNAACALGSFILETWDRRKKVNG